MRWKISPSLPGLLGYLKYDSIWENTQLLDGFSWTKLISPENALFLHGSVSVLLGPTVLENIKNFSLISNCAFWCHFFWDSVSLHIPGCHAIHCVDYVGLELSAPPVSASQVLRLRYVQPWLSLDVILKIALGVVLAQEQTYKLMKQNKSPKCEYMWL